LLAIPSHHRHYLYRIQRKTRPINSEKGNCPSSSETKVKNELGYMPRIKRKGVHDLSKSEKKPQQYVEDVPRSKNLNRERMIRAGY